MGKILRKLVKAADEDRLICSSGGMLRYEVNKYNVVIIKEIVIERKMRHTGVGKYLLATLYERHPDAYCITTFVPDEWPHAVEWFEKQGFYIVGVDDCDGSVLLSKSLKDLEDKE